ncbi:MAG: tetratricopeptide repeat protein [Candidatus Zixiibacteriota bacterium]
MNRLQITILATCGLLILARIVASFFPHLRFWGLSQLHYFSLEFRIGLSVIGLLILIPRVNKIVAGVLGRVFDSIAERLKKMNRYLLYSATSFLSLIPFWLLRSRTPLLGDGYMRAGEIRMGKLFSVAEPLDALLHLLFSKFFGLDAYTTYGVLSCLAGGLFVFLLLLLCDLLGENGREKLLIFSVVLTMGATLLFFGYIESYTLMYAAMAGYVLFAVRYLKGRGGFLLPCVFMVLTAGFHLSAIFVLPSLFYLAFAPVIPGSGQKVRKSRFVNPVILTFVTALIGLGFYVVRAGSSQGSVGHLLIYPFGGGDEGYSFFSLGHLLDFVNHQILVSPVNVVLWMVLLLLFWRRISLKDNVARFLFWLGICSLGFALLVDPKLGYARDWDLFAFSSLGATLLGLYLILSLVGELTQAASSPGQEQTPGGGEGRAMDLRPVTLALVVTSLVSTLPWILVNASEQKAVARFEDLLKMDEKGTAHGYETLACYFRDRGEHQRSAKSWRDAIALNPGPRYFGALGNAYQRLGEYDKAIEAYDRSLRMASHFPGVARVHKNFGNTLAKAGRFEEAVLQLKKAIDLRPGRTEVHQSLGNILGKLGRYQEAVPYLEMALESDPGNVALYKALGTCYAAMGRKEEAGMYLKTYLQSRPEDARKIEEIMDSLEVDIQY